MPTTTPSELLPCEHALLPALQVLAAAEDGGDHASRDAALVAVLREHPFVTVSKSEARAEAGAPVVAGEGLILQSAEHFRTNVRAFNKWLKTHEGKPYAKQAGGPSDDGLYTVSAVLRRCLPRGLSLFTFAAAGSESAGGVEDHVLVRGFRKFTGLTDEDEDEESAAARQNESFLYSQAAAERCALPFPLAPLPFLSDSHSLCVSASYSSTHVRTHTDSLSRQRPTAKTASLWCTTSRAPRSSSPVRKTPASRGGATQTSQQPSPLRLRRRGRMCQDRGSQRPCSKSGRAGPRCVAAYCVLRCYVH